MRLPRDLSGEELGAGLCGKYRHLWSKKQTRPYPYVAKSSEAGLLSPCHINGGFLINLNHL